MGYKMKVVSAIENGLEYLNVTSPNFDVKEMNSIIKSSNGSSFLIDSYVASMFADKLSDKTLESKIILTSFSLTYFTGASVRKRFDDVVRAVKALPNPDLMIHNEGLYRKLNIEDNKISKLAVTAIKMVKPLLENIGTVVLVIPPTEHIDKLYVYFQTIIVALGLKKVSFFVDNTVDIDVVLKVLKKFPARVISTDINLLAKIENEMKGSTTEHSISDGYAMDCLF